MKRKMIVALIIVLAMLGMAMQDAAVIGGGQRVQRGAAVPILATATPEGEDEPAMTKDPCLLDFDLIYTPQPPPPQVYPLEYVSPAPVDYGYPPQNNDYGYPVP